ncbi:PhzF family phenazine biosynthesis protein [Aggregicoccus sp. 17bor-14]|uniref:PhzF family phenazine biosynthesis protein n=1 Tax=Myxococcaceae TaxID=31 RepID=UPI00129C1A75|nr:MULTISPECIES: PhzF family phenazine biosynthesis protein [Myxococcaceae]MBF5042951.1 PhzF family phenazine biosynthesis protein [Simulacricoccus sp. 17bor-14]MRI88717.1 PhzF family phenazine biosynthesis protein [Aggregicoccus sp. 17bor-14]
MRLPLFQVDAFTPRVFGGNPAAVVPLDTWLPDATLQSIALENNLSETAFFVREPAGHHLRWFTPTQEVDLCGHATLASAWVLFERLEPGLTRVEFATRSGTLTVTREEGGLLAMDFPARPPTACAPPEGLAEALGAAPLGTLKGSRDLLAVFDSEAEVRSLRPDMARLAALDVFAVVPTARGEDCDFVSRFFGPRVGVPEDPVTGSSHCTLVPYWARVLGKPQLFARQVSARGGELHCEAQGERVRIAGHAALYLEGTLRLG